MIVGMILFIVMVNLLVGLVLVKWVLIGLILVLMLMVVGIFFELF